MAGLVVSVWSLEPWLQPGELRPWRDTTLQTLHHPTTPPPHHPTTSPLLPPLPPLPPQHLATLPPQHPHHPATPPGVLELSGSYDVFSGLVDDSHAMVRLTIHALPQDTPDDDNSDTEDDVALAEPFHERIKSERAKSDLASGGTGLGGSPRSIVPSPRQGPRPNLQTPPQLHLTEQIVAGAVSWSADLVGFTGRDGLESSVMHSEGRSDLVIEPRTALWKPRNGDSGLTPLTPCPYSSNLPLTSLPPYAPTLFALQWSRPCLRRSPGAPSTRRAPGQSAKGRWRGSGPC